MRRLIIIINLSLIVAFMMMFADCSDSSNGRKQVSIISRRIIKTNSSLKREMQELSIYILTGKGLLLWESCGGKRYLWQLTIDN